VECRACEQAEIHRAEIMAEPRQRIFLRLHRATGYGVPFENPDFPALFRQMRRAGQTVVAGTDAYGVKFAHAPNPFPLGLKIIADA
jgi:hypothetical protein